MRYYYSADAIREAEAPLLASLPEGVLMRRAANGLANAIARELTARTGGVAGRSVCAVVGSGDNGGDALWAAALLRRRCLAGCASLCDPHHQRAVRHNQVAGVHLGGLSLVPGNPRAEIRKSLDDAVGSGPLRPFVSRQHLSEAGRKPLLC